ncbi:MAG: PRC-barrel domain-containing protein [Sphingomonas bacterium]|nr:PRC-barrel domain-containing protein [Sphingomonas bacterium]
METILTWVAPVATIIAALMTASNLGSRITGAGFIVFTIGSLSWLALGMIGDNPALLWMNAVLTLLNLFGIWRWLGRQAKFEDGGQHAAAASAAKSSETLFPLSLTAKAALSGQDGTELGKCVDAMAGCSTGRIAYLVVAEGGVGGVGERLRRLDWSDVAVDLDTITANLDRDGFERLDELEKGKWPGR